MIDASATAARAAERQAWPAVEFIVADGSPIGSGSLTRIGNWIVVYVSRDSRACDAMLASIQQDAADRVVVIVAGDAEAVAAAARSRENLRHAIWVGDPGAAFRDRLKIDSTPVVIGVRDSTIEWSLAGVFANTSDVSAILVNWLRAAP